MRAPNTSGPTYAGLVAAPVLSQHDRDGRLEVPPLGPDKLVLRRFEGRERISQNFEYVVEALSTDGQIDLDQILGVTCCVSLRTFGHTERFFSGVATDAERLGTVGNFHAYRLILRPWTWLLTRRTHTRIFKDKDVTEILKEVFDLAGFRDWDRRTTQSFEKIEYCVQYRETDYDFASRLMQEWGIYTFFEHSRDKHVLILCDDRNTHRRINLTNSPSTKRRGVVEEVVDAITRIVAPTNEDFTLVERETRAGQDQQHLSGYVALRTFRSGKVSLNDYDYEKPGANLRADEESSERYPANQHELQDYPGRYTKPKTGKWLAKVRLQAGLVADHVFALTGEAPALEPGGYFSLAPVRPNDDRKGEYLVINAVHRYGDQGYETTNGGDVARYSGEYLVMRHSRQYRAPQTTPRPYVAGPQTATVTNKDGKKKGTRGSGKDWIDVDDDGRILVYFHWERDRKGPERFSRRVRVAQLWSGNSWGFQVIPRVGQEVVVTFLEGDPDQPLVIGTVYNGDNKHPYAPKSDFTMSGVKTETAEGSPGYNELVFDDRAKKETVRMHAQRFHEETVRDQQTVKLAEDNSTGKAREVRIVKGDDIHTHQKGNQKVALQAGNREVKIVGSDKLETTDVISVESKTAITLTCGQSKIELTPTSLSISSMVVQIKGTVSTDVQAGGPMMISGAIVRIN